MVSRWTEVDQYVESLLIPGDDTLESALRASDAAELPAYHVSPAQGKLLHLLARMCQAQRILEIGALAGYSTIWLARALPVDGRLVTLEINASYAAVAQRNLAQAGVAGRVQVRVAPASESLQELLNEEAPPFDFIFIDADKASCAEYFTLALKLSRVGTTIVVDNVVREGNLADQTSADPNVQGVRRLHELLAKETRVSATTIQTVGSKGYDGFLLAVVNSSDRPRGE